MKTKTVLLALFIAATFGACNTEKEDLKPTAITLEDYYGSYYVETTCGQSYNMSIRQQNPAQNDTVMIDGLLNFFDYTYALVEGKNISFSDGEYAMCNGNPTTYGAHGSGTFVDDVITINYTWSHCGDGGDCTLTATKY